MALHLKWSARASAVDIDGAIDDAFRKLGYPSVKQEQREAVRCVLLGRDCFVTVPTGFGKSAIFHALPVCASTILEQLCDSSPSSLVPCVVVISPLVSLMTDQVSKLKSMGITSVVQLSEELLPHTDSKITHLFASPEAFIECTRWRKLFLENDDFVSNILAIVVDEAHCIVKWGDQFRTVYSNIAQLKSLVPTNTPVLALTATATNTTKGLISRSLRLDDPFVISVSPDRPNVHYSVVRIPVRDVTVPFKWLVEDLQRERRNLAKTIVFCRSIAACTKLYKHFLTCLRSDSYDPKGASPSIPNRLFAMYHARVDEEDKKAILGAFQPADGTCRILFSTIAFGMGVDIPDIRTVIHYGPSGDIESYFQESGRAGRDGKESRAILCVYPGSLLGHVDKSMKAYCVLEDGKCRREELLKHFPGRRMQKSICPPHACCDQCTQKCECGQEREHTIMTMSNAGETVDEECSLPDRTVTDVQIQLLQSRLLELRSCLLLPAGSTHLYVGDDLACGLPLQTIDVIVRNCRSIHTASDLEELCGIWHLAGKIIQIIDDIFDNY